LPSPEIANGTKADYLITEERYNPGTLLPYLEGQEIKNKVNLSLDVYRHLLEFDKHLRHPVKNQVVEFISRTFEDTQVEKHPEIALANRNKLMQMLAYDEYFNHSETKRNTLR